MSSSENSMYFLRLTFSEIYKHLVKVMVFNYNNRLVESRSLNRNEIVYLLTPGLYTLRLEMNGLITDEVFFMDRDRDYHIDDKKYNDAENILSPPKQYSSALLGETYGSSHEYYTYPAMEWSSKDTGFSPANVAEAGNSSLYIFMRFPSLEIFNEIKPNLLLPFYFGFEIVDETGNTIARFDTLSEIVIDENFGWVAFNRPLKSGLYFLIYNGNEPRQIPIYIYDNWHTQFFMTLGREPLYGTIRIFLAQNRIFDPEQPYHKYIDIFLDKLQNKDYTMDEELMFIASGGEFQSPMLGLICCYLYLKGTETKNDDLFLLIFENLKEFILKDGSNSPDIQALYILASLDFPDKGFQIRNVQGTPMFRLGFEAILNASVENPGLIEEYSLNDFISENLYSDSPYTTFKPVPFLNNIQVSLPQSAPASPPPIMEAREKSGLNFFGKEDIRKMKAQPSPAPPAAAAENPTPISDPYESNIIETLNDSVMNYLKTTPLEASGDSWLKNSISELLQNQKSMSISEISKNLGVSGNTVNRIFKQWKEGSDRATNRGEGDN